MIKNAKEKMESLSDNDTWLLQHMITVFWHIFGIANGLDIKKEDIETIHYSKGVPRTAYRVKAAVMQQKLADYLHWLESDKESWGTEQFRCSAEDREKIYAPLHKERVAVARMIELLQI